MMPEGLDALPPEERRRVHKTMYLKGYTYACGGTELDGTFFPREGFYAEKARHYQP